MKKWILALFLVSAANAQWSMGWRAELTTWNTSIQPLPLWGTVAHPGGQLDLQFQPRSWRVGLFAGLGGDPHRPMEATSAEVGVRGDLVKIKRFAVTGEASLGIFYAPSFNAQCGNYEEMYDCHPTAPPEFCPWFSTNVGFGTRVEVNKTFALEPLKVRYMSPYGIGPRWEVSSGFRVKL
jgi:hypothetical protein